jgi:hypothetical protein
VGAGVFLVLLSSINEMIHNSPACWREKNKTTVKYMYCRA